MVSEDEEFRSAENPAARLASAVATTSVIGRAILRYFPIDLLTIITPPTYRQAAP